MSKKEEKLKKVLNFIEEFTKEYNYPPSVREIAEACEIKSTASVYDYVDELTKSGKLVKNGNKKRTLSSSRQKVRYSISPCVGIVTAGKPILAQENIEDYYPIPSEFGEDTFILNVIGCSMIDSGIYSGDKIIVKQQNTADNGDIIVALIDNEATVKRFYKSENKIILHPENKTMSDIVLDNVEILGKVIGLLRKF